MGDDQLGSRTRRIIDPHALCRGGPELSLLLAPDLTIVAASDAYLRATFKRWDEIRGSPMFDVFPDNPHDAAADGVRNLSDSFKKVLQRGEPDRMAIQRYDVRDCLADDGLWVEKSWVPLNVPVFAAGSREVTHVLHRVEDVTQVVWLRRRLQEQSLVTAEQLDTLDRMRQDLVRRQREVAAAEKSLGAMLRAGRLQEPLVAALQEQLGTPVTRQYWAAGRHAPVTGIYELVHDRACLLGLRNAYLRAGQPFRQCPGCRSGVLYRLDLQMR